MSGHKAPTYIFTGKNWTLINTKDYYGKNWTLINTKDYYGKVSIKKDFETMLTD
jgi:hypothetical protein